MTDLKARIAAVFSVVLSIAALYYARAQGPYYYAQPHQMMYWTVESNLLTEEKTPQSGSLSVHIRNNAKTPARDVLVVVRPLSSKPRITCSENFTLQDGPDGTILVKVGRVPATMTVKLSVIEEVKEYRRSWNVMGGPDYRYSAVVFEVQTEFGTIQKDYTQCKEYLAPLPDDKGAHEPW